MQNKSESAEDHWKRSRPHLALLACFLNARPIDDILRDERWPTVLGEPVSNAVSRFMSSGALTHAGVPEGLAYLLKVSDLKKMAKERGLSQSGRKDQIIARLVNSDYEGMAAVASRIDLLVCTDSGRAIAQEYVAGEDATRQAAETLSLAALERHDFLQAARVVAQYEAEQVFPRGIGIDWSDPDQSRTVALTEGIFQARPTQVHGFDDESLERLRIAAAMMSLWGTSRPGTWLDVSKLSGSQFDGESAARMLIFSSLFVQDIARYREMGVKEVQILGTNDGTSCEACQKISGMVYRLDEVPSLPYAKCTCKIGCRCMASPVIER